jgi:hypothetical protein
VEPSRIERLNVLSRPEVRELLGRSSHVLQIGVDRPDGLLWQQTRLLWEEGNTGALWVADPGALPGGEPLREGDTVSVFLRVSAREFVFDTVVLSRDTRGLDSAGRSREPAILLDMPRAVYLCVRRRHARVVPAGLTRATVHLSVGSERLSAEALVGDLSLGGAYLVCRRPYPAFNRAAQPECMVIVGLMRAALGRVVIDLLATVLRVTRESGSGGDLSLGVEWLVDGHEDALSRLDELLRNEVRGALRRKLRSRTAPAR